MGRGVAKGKGASVYGEEVKCQKESDKKFQIFCKSFPLPIFCMLR